MDEHRNVIGIQDQKDGNGWSAESSSLRVDSSRDLVDSSLSHVYDMTKIHLDSIVIKIMSQCVASSTRGIMSN